MALSKKQGAKWRKLKYYREMEADENKDKFMRLYRAFLATECSSSKQVPRSAISEFIDRLLTMKPRQHALMRIGDIDLDWDVFVRDVTGKSYDRVNAWIQIDKLKDCQTVVGDMYNVWYHWRREVASTTSRSSRWGLLKYQSVIEKDAETERFSDICRTFLLAKQAQGSTRRPIVDFMEHLLSLKDDRTPFHIDGRHVEWSAFLRDISGSDYVKVVGWSNIYSLLDQPDSQDMFHDICHDMFHEWHEGRDLDWKNHSMVTEVG